MRLRPLTLAVLAVPAVLAPAAIADGPTTATAKAVQNVTGTVAVHNPTKGAPLVVTRHARSAGIIAQESNGVVGWFFAVDPATRGGEFVLTSGTAGADFDILFYADNGDLASRGRPPVSAGDFNGTVGDGERGIVPEASTYAVVYPAAAPNASFTFTGYAIPRIAIGVDGLDLTVPAGGAVTWVNKTSDYSFVRSTKTPLNAEFSSGDGVGTGIPVNATFTAKFSRPGIYVYETSAGSGTITVK
jgi:plastocyanin